MAFALVGVAPGVSLVTVGGDGGVIFMVVGEVVGMVGGAWGVVFGGGLGLVSLSGRVVARHGWIC